MSFGSVNVPGPYCPKTSKLTHPKSAAHASTLDIPVADHVSVVKITL